MSAPLIARLVAIGRICFGLALMASPSRVTARWLGRDAGRVATRVVTRALGARDVALGVGALAAPESQLRPWMAAGIFADTADLVATAAGGNSLPRAGRVLTGTLAAAGAAVGVVAFAGLGPPSASA